MLKELDRLLVLYPSFSKHIGTTKKHLEDHEIDDNVFLITPFASRPSTSASGSHTRTRAKSPKKDSNSNSASKSILKSSKSFKKSKKTKTPRNPKPAGIVFVTPNTDETGPKSIVAPLSSKLKQASQYLNDISEGNKMTNQSSFQTLLSSIEVMDKLLSTQYRHKAKLVNSRVSFK